MTLNPVRIGVAGTGRFGTLHALTLVGLAESKLAALVDPSLPALESLPLELAEFPKYRNLEDALTETEVEAWVVAASTSEHVSITKRLLESGACVLLEKPIAGSLKEALLLTDLVDGLPEKLMLGHILLFNSEFRALRKECERRGSFDYATCYRMRPVRHADDYPGETPFHLTMVHDLYCIQSLVHGEDPVQFQAQKHYNSRGNMDLALSQLQWSNGRLATFSAGFLTPEGLSDEGFDRMEVYGKGWMARMSPNPRPLELWDETYAPPMSLEILTGPEEPSGMLAEELRCFCRVVRGLEPVHPGTRYKDGIQVMRWLDRLIKELK